MNSLKELKPKKLLFSIFASGNSLLDLTQEELNLIKSKSFVIGINYSIIKYDIDMLIWSDKRPSDFLQDYIKTNGKKCLFLSREKAFTNQNHKVIMELVDFWFDEKKENLFGNYTIVWLIQLLKRYFPDIPIAIFGLDMTTPSSEQAKWYDKFTSHDKDGRGFKYPTYEKLKQCADQLDKIQNKDRIWNCNLNSNYKGFTFLENWKEKFMMLNQ